VRYCFSGVDHVHKGAGCNWLWQCRNYGRRNSNGWIIQDSSRPGLSGSGIIQYNTSWHVRKMEMSKAFEYSYTHQFTENEYIAISTSYTFSSRLLLPALVGAIGILLLFSAYTLILGIVCLAFVPLKLFLPKLAERGLHNDFMKRKIFRQPITYTLTDSELKIQSDGIDGRSSWSHLVSWREYAGWFILKVSGIGTLYFPIVNLKNAGIYDLVVQIAKKHAKRN